MPKDKSNPVKYMLIALLTLTIITLASLCAIGQTYQSTDCVEETYIQFGEETPRLVESHPSEMKIPSITVDNVNNTVTVGDTVYSMLDVYCNANLVHDEVENMIDLNDTIKLVLYTDRDFKILHYGIRYCSHQNDESATYVYYRHKAAQW